MQRFSLSVLSLLLFGTSAQAWASGYHFGTQSVSAQATANASAAEANDASTIFYNPAGITRLKGSHFSASLNMVAPDVNYFNAKANYPSQAYAAVESAGLPPGLNASAPVQGTTGGKITENWVFVPHLYASHQVNDRVTVGLGVYVPFASGVEYQRDSVLRYNLNYTELKTFAFNPVLAWKANEEHAFAMGLVMQRAQAKLRQYANAGGSANPILNNVRPNAGAGHGRSDAVGELSVDDIGFGYTLAWLWQPSEDTRFGVTYRSKIEHLGEGKTRWTMPNTLAGQVAASRGYVTGDSSAKMTTPEALSIHGYHQVGKWAWMFDLTRTWHSRFRELRIQYADPKTAGFSYLHGGASSNETTLFPQWRDTWKLALGATYQWSEPLQLRFGVAYDQSPIAESKRRMTTMPDNDRIWLSLGGRYDFDRHHSVNVAYSYIHVRSASAQPDGFCGAATAGAVNCVSSYVQGSADYHNRAQIFGIQYNHTF